MNNKDISKQVMKKVALYERRRTAWWFRKFMVILIVLLLSIAALGALTIQILSDSQSWDLLTLFRQDPEIISAYWKDTLWVFWEEMPQHAVYIALILIIIVVGIIVFTRHKRNILKKKLHQLEMYK